MKKLNTFYTKAVENSRLIKNSSLDMKRGLVSLLIYYIGGYRGGAEGAAAPLLFSCNFKMLLKS